MIPALIAVAAVITAAVAFWVLRTQLRIARRRRLRSRPLSPEHIALVEKNVPLYRRLPESLKAELHGLINVFLAEKRFEGCNGFEITDEVRLTIAAQACMLLLNRPTRLYSSLDAILIYPDTYVARQTTFDGVMETESEDTRLGESWQRGPVVLAWNSVTGGTRNRQDGHNVVIHEFAHQLDQADGAADGAPILHSRSAYPKWAEVFTEEYESLRKAKQLHRRSVLDKYGTTNPAEFFAVATEAFFEKPRQLHKRHSELYAELKSYYNLDPVEWD